VCRPAATPGYREAHRRQEAAGLEREPNRWLLLIILLLLFGGGAYVVTSNLLLVVIVVLVVMALAGYTGRSQWRR
jgi:4-hydroxybenzoate polyprenyltransferase